MYKFKKERIEEVKNKYKLDYLADKIGITRVNLSYIINGKSTTKKTTAYCITKAINPNAEINDYFLINK